MDDIDRAKYIVEKAIWCADKVVHLAKNKKFEVVLAIAKSALNGNANANMKLAIMRRYMGSYGPDYVPSPCKYTRNLSRWAVSKAVNSVYYFLAYFKYAKQTWDAMQALEYAKNNAECVFTYVLHAIDDEGITRTRDEIWPHN